MKRICLQLTASRHTNAHTHLKEKEEESIRKVDNMRALKQINIFCSQITIISFCDYEKKYEHLFDLDS
jgi:hypothetical protein